MQAISKFQDFAGLAVSGQLDKETVDMMLRPRCGVKDFIDDDEDVDTPRIKVKSTLSRKKVRPHDLISCWSVSWPGVFRDMFCKAPGGG